jgi:proline iminopeptidase
MGLGMPLSLWPDAFVEGLAREGFALTLFDNRDVGRSQRIPAAPLSNPLLAIGRVMLGLKVSGIYTLEDMAQDTAALMTAIGLPSAHVIGMSMGGMIAQVLAARHPDRVRSLTSIMSSSGNPYASLGKTRALQAILHPPPDPRDVEAAAAHLKNVLRIIGSRRYPASDALLDSLCRRVVERGLDVEGARRQLFAILASGDRRAALATIRAPTLVIHGVDDPLLRVGASRDIARHVAGAKLMEVEGMAHDLPLELTPMLVKAIAEHCCAAEAARPGSRAESPA